MTADRKITIIRHEYRVPLRPEWGAAGADVVKKWAIAQRDYREINGTAPEVALTDDAIRFTADDENIVIYFAEARETG